MDAGIVTFNNPKTPFWINRLKLGNKPFFNKGSICSKHPPSIPIMIFLIYTHLIAFF